MQQIRPHLIAVICACVTLFDLSANAEAQSDKTNQNQNLKGTDVERSLLIVSTTDVVEVKELLAGWQRLYPQIQVDYIHKPSLEVFDSVIIAKRAPRVQIFRGVRRWTCKSNWSMTVTHNPIHLEN